MIDPVVNVLETAFTTEDPITPQTVWRPLYRLAITAKQLPFVVGNDAPNIFGDAFHIKDCQHLVCYSINGALALAFKREGPKNWARYEPSEESTGRTERYHSVRHVFADETDLNRYMELLEKMGGNVAGLGHPNVSDAFELMTILARSPHPPRVLPVVNITRE